MKVYLVFREEPYEGDELEGVFVTNEAAAAAIKLLARRWNDRFRIEECEVQGERQESQADP